MPASATCSAPKYRLYRPKHLGVVRLNGRDFYLGEYGSVASREKYDQLVAQWLANGRQLPSASAGDQSQDCPPISVNEVLLAYWRHAEAHYATADGHSKELTCMEHAIRPLKKLFGLTPACDFGPKALKAVRQTMIEADICRRQINSRINRIRRVFKWAVSEELIPPSVLHGLRAVTGLQKGRTIARESRPVKPVDVKHVDSVLPFVSPQVAAMIQLQLQRAQRVARSHASHFRG